MQSTVETTLLRTLEDALFPRQTAGEDDWFALAKAIDEVRMDDSALDDPSACVLDDPSPWLFNRAGEDEYGDILCQECEEEEDAGVEWMDDYSAAPPSDAITFENKLSGRAVVVLEGVVNLPPKERMLHLLRDHRTGRVFQEPLLLEPIPQEESPVPKWWGVHRMLLFVQ